MNVYDYKDLPLDEKVNYLERRLADVNVGLDMIANKAHDVAAQLALHGAREDDGPLIRIAANLDLKVDEARARATRMLRPEEGGTP